MSRLPFPSFMMSMCTGTQSLRWRSTETQLKVLWRKLRIIIRSMPRIGVTPNAEPVTLPQGGGDLKSHLKSANSSTLGAKPARPKNAFRPVF